MAILRLLTLVFKQYRPHYFSIILEAFEQASNLNYKKITFIEFGVAGGNELLYIENYSQKAFLTYLN